MSLRYASWVALHLASATFTFGLSSFAQSGVAEPPTVAEPQAPPEDAPPAETPPPAAPPVEAPPSASAAPPASEAPGTETPPPPAPDTPQPSAPAPAAPAKIVAPPAEPVAPAETVAPPAEPAASPAPEAAPTPPEPVEITVAGSRINRAAGSAHVIHRKQLERFRYDDPNAILMQVPGVYIRQEDGIGLRPNIGIRGANPDRSKKLTLMEDGVLFGPAPYSAPAAYYFPLMPLMTNVRVVKGPSAIAYGPQTVGGAIDFVTRPIPSRTTGMAELALGQYGYNQQHGYFGSSTERLGFLVEGVRLQNSGFKELPNGADTGSTRSDVIAKFNYVLDPHAESRHEFLLKLAYAHEVSNETYLGLTDADFRANPLQRYAASALDQMRNDRTAITVQHRFEAPSLHLSVKTTAYRHDYHRVWRKVNRLRGAAIAPVLENPEDPLNASYYAVLTGREDSAGGQDAILIGPNDRTFTSQGVQSVLEWRGATGPLQHRVEAGVRGHYDEIIRRHSEDGFLMSGGRLVPDGSATLVTAANTDSTYALAVHALDAISWKNLTVTPGIRAELIRSESDDRLANTDETGFVTALMPGVGLFAGVTPDFGLLAGVYRGFSPPPPGSDDHVDPEYSVNYEAGARFARGAARLEAIGFYNDYQNLTDVCTLASGCLTDNLDRQFDAGKARIYGVEAYAAHEVPIAGSVVAPFSIAYTHTRAQFRSDFVSQDPIYGEVKTGDEIPYVPRHQLGATAGVEGRLAGGVVGVNYVSPMREEAGNEPLSEALATDEQFWVDVGATLKPLRFLTLYANLRNVFDAHDIVSRRPFGARPNAPRWFSAGAKAEF